MHAHTHTCIRKHTIRNLQTPASVKQVMNLWWRKRQYRREKHGRSIIFEQKRRRRKEREGRERETSRGWIWCSPEFCCCCFLYCDILAFQYKISSQRIKTDYTESQTVFFCKDQCLKHWQTCLTGLKIYFETVNPVTSGPLTTSNRNNIIRVLSIFWHTL